MARPDPHVNGAGTPGPGVRGELEHNPSDSQQALEALNAEWGVPYAVSYHEGLYLARRREGPPGPVISGETPDEIAAELSRDWGEAP